MPAYFGEFSGEESEPHVPTPMETFGKYDKKSLMTGVVIGQGLKGRAHAPTDPAPAGFPSDLWRDARDRADAAMREIAAAESGSGSGSATPPDWEFDKDAFCFGLAVGRSLEGWEIDGAMDLPDGYALIIYRIHLDEADNVSLFFDTEIGKKARIIVDWGDGRETSRLVQRNSDATSDFVTFTKSYETAGDYTVVIVSDTLTSPHYNRAGGLDRAMTPKYALREAYFVQGVPTVVNSMHTENGYLLEYGGGFTSFPNLEFVYIGDSVTHLSSQAFSGCQNLKAVRLGNGLTELNNAFMNCRNLPSSGISFGNSLVYLNGFGGSYSGNAWHGCEKITSITIPESVKLVACFDHSGLTKIVIPDNVTKIGTTAFWGCKNLASVEIGAGVTSIGFRAFWGCDSLTSVFIPKNVKTIHCAAFSYCDNLESVVIEEGVEAIGPFISTEGSGTVFQECKKLAYVEIPQSVKYIGYASFAQTKLTSVTISSDCVVGEFAFPRGCEISYY